MPRQQMIESVTALAPGETVVEAVVAQERRNWWPIGVGAFAVVGVVIGLVLDAGAIVEGAIIGGFVGAGFVAFTKTWILARTDAAVLLCHSSIWRASATEIEQRYPPGTPIRKTGGFINEVYAFEGRQLVVSKAHTARLEQVTNVMRDTSA